MTKNLFFTFILFAVSITTLHAQGNMYSEERSVNGFTKISASNAIDLYITEGTSKKITVETNYAEVLPLIQTEVKSGELRVSLKKENRPKYKSLKMKVHVQASKLTEINATSAADIYSVGVLTTDDIKLSATSGADINLQLTARNISCSSTSGSDIKLKGTATSARVNASSGADIDMKEMIVENVTASATSGSDIDLHVTGDLKASATSGSDITYRGNPQNVDQNRSSGGSIKKK